MKCLRVRNVFDFNEPGQVYEVVRGGEVVGSYVGDGTETRELPSMRTGDSLRRAQARVGPSRDFEYPEPGTWTCPRPGCDRLMMDQTEHGSSTVHGYCPLHGLFAWSEQREAWISGS